MEKSFGYELKENLCDTEKVSQRLKSVQLYGLLLFCRGLTDDGLRFLTENQNVAVWLCDAIDSLIKTMPLIEYSKMGGGRYTYCVTLSGKDNVLKLLSCYGYSSTTQLNIPEDIASGREEISYVVRGAYLSCGSITDPYKDYHIEFTSLNEDRSKMLCGALMQLNITAKTTSRRGAFSVYIKESEQIEDLLTIMGNSHLSMEIMNAKIYKEIRNGANRLTNCETANINKTVYAAAAQIADIQLVLSTMGEDALPQELLQTARLRMDNPEMSLSELCEIAGGLSKSGINHRLKRLSQMAQKIKEDKV